MISLRVTSYDYVGEIIDVRYIDVEDVSLYANLMHVEVGVDDKINWSSESCWFRTNNDGSIYIEII